MEDERIDEFRNMLRSIKEEVNEKFIYGNQNADEVDKLIKAEIVKRYYAVREALMNEPAELKRLLMYYLDLDLLTYNNTYSQERIDELEEQKKKQ
jgi:hypothetical protein